MLKRIFLCFGLILYSKSLLAQYHVEACKAKASRNESCLVKDFGSVEEFKSGDLELLSSYLTKYPELPWLKLIDSKHELLSTLESGLAAVKNSEKTHYKELLAQLKSHPGAEVAFEASVIFLRSHPKRSFYFSSKDKKLVKNFASKISSKTAIEVEAYKHCKPNSEKYQAIMKMRDQCSNLEESSNSISLYSVLAEIASCEDYNISAVGIAENAGASSLTPDSPCVVALDNVSASIGGGTVDIKSKDQVYNLNWLAGHDLSGKKNDMKFWRDQLEPQLQKSISKKEDAKPERGVADDNGK